IRTTANSQFNQLYGIDVENNSPTDPIAHPQDIIEAGTMNQYIGTFGGLMTHIASGAKGTQIVGGKWFDIYVDPGAISVGIAHALLQHCIVDNSGGSANVRLQSNWVTGLPNWHDVGCISGFGNSGYDQIGNTLVHRRLIVKPPQTDPA